MKYIIPLLFFAFTATNAFSQAQYQIVKDEKHPEQVYLVGIINKYLVQNDTAFSKWYNSSMSYYTPDTATLATFGKAKKGIQFVVFGGTWCEDTHNLWPVFYRLVDKSGYPEKYITLIGVDRAKTSIEDLHRKWNIVNVPTFIVLQDGKEIGRVVEYGKYGQVDKELGEIVASIK